MLEQALAWCIDQGQLRRHAERIRTRLDQARAQRQARLGARLQLRRAAGYLLAPGALFHASRQPSTLMRINFATTQDAQFWKVFAKVRDAM